MHLTVYSYYVAYAFPSESTLYSCLNVKELLAPNRRNISSWSECNGTQTQNHLVCNRTLSHLAKQTKWHDKNVRDMIRIDSQMHRTDKSSQHSSIIWPVWLNGWVFVCKLSVYGFHSHCSHLKFRYLTGFKQGVPLHLGNYRVWIHSETRTWHDNNIQSEIGATKYS